MRLGGPKKNFRGGAFPPKMFLNFRQKSLNFGVFWALKKSQGSKWGNSRVIYYLYHYCGGAGQDYWGGHGPSGPPLTTSLLIIHLSLVTLLEIEKTRLF